MTSLAQIFSPIDDCRRNFIYYPIHLKAAIFSYSRSKNSSSFSKMLEVAAKAPFLSWMAPGIKNKFKASEYAYEGLDFSLREKYFDAKLNPVSGQNIQILTHFTFRAYLTYHLNSLLIHIVALSSIFAGRPWLALQTYCSIIESLLTLLLSPIIYPIWKSEESKNILAKTSFFNFFARC